MEGRIRLLTAVTPSHAHAYQTLSHRTLGRHSLPKVPLLLTRLYSCLAWSLPTEAHLEHAGARLHTDNTADLSSIIEALSFLGPAGPVARGSQACIFYESKTCGQHLYGNDPVTHERTFGQHESATFATHSVEATNHHATYLSVTGKTWSTNARTVLPLSGRLASFRTRTFTHVGPALPLIPLPCLVHVITWVKP